MADAPPPRFKVVLKQADRDLLRQWADAAIHAGGHEEFVHLLKALNFRLSYEADEWGESREDLPALGLQMRFGAVGRLSVHYGVHLERALVFVKEFRYRAPH